MSREVEQREADEISVKVALGALTAFQGYVQQADAKVNTLLMVHTGGVVAAVAALGGRAAIRWTPVVDGLLLAFAVAFCASGFHIAKAIRPRLHAPTPPNPFGITGVGLPPPPCRRAQCEQAWAMAELLGEIALAKNRHVQRAVPWTALMLCLGVVAAVVGG
ncbi:hypothetical protein ACFY2W_24650 [Streptomyces sp. NPDC001262]|uniref:hypothetical protein n=1 Tax=Streptomyces TaxID=1883 RepID=UPI0036C46453